MKHTRKIILSGLFLALALVLPLITFQIPIIGEMLTPMHFPIILGSIFIGPIFGLAIGVVAPILRMVIFGMPPMPLSVMMAFELGAYGLFMGLFVRLFGKIKMKYFLNIVLSLIITIILGRLVFALSAMIFLQNVQFIEIFVGTFVTSAIGIGLQMIIIPILSVRLKDYVKFD